MKRKHINDMNLDETIAEYERITAQRPYFAIGGAVIGVALGIGYGFWLGIL